MSIEKLEAVFSASLQQVLPLAGAAGSSRLPPSGLQADGYLDWPCMAPEAATLSKSTPSQTLHAIAEKSVEERMGRTKTTWTYIRQGAHKVGVSRVLLNT